MDKKLPEILAPAGDLDCAKAAVLAGANAIYIGLKKFNARERAANIGIQELKEIVSIAHERNIKVFVTMNTLLTEAEIYEAFAEACEIYKAGADALIIQDPGLGYVIHKFIPEFELHASTQMTTHNSLQLEFLEKAGITNVNFARELSFDELAAVVPKAEELNINPEIFVHGAYCISCSGICYMSSFISSQAGNRGKCLQPCRRMYSLTPFGEKKYFFSLKDNNALENIDKILETGAKTLKIEGRIKNFSYVYTTVRAWREHLDKTALDSDVSHVFNRGFSTGYFDGHITPDMFVKSPLDQSMVCCGNVLSFNADRQILLIEENEKSIVQGSRINIYTKENLFICGAVIKDVLGNGKFHIAIENLLHGKILKGQIVTLYPEPCKMENLREKILELKPKNILFDVAVSGEKGKFLKAVFSIPGKKVEVCSSLPLDMAKNACLTLDSIKEQFQKTDREYCTLNNIVDSGLENGLFLPIRELNRIRREALEKLFVRNVITELSEHHPVKIADKRKMSILVSDINEAEILASECDFVFIETLPGMEPDIFGAGKNIYPWFPAWITDDVIPYYKTVLAGKPEYVVSDNTGLGLLAASMGIKWIAGPMLNSSNSFTFASYAQNGGAWGGFCSSELNEEQLGTIGNLENFTAFMQVFGPVTMMTTRQCLLASSGKCRSGRNEFTSECLYNCSGYEEFYDEKNIPFHIVKTPGYLNRVFNEALLFIPEACADVVNVDYFLVDLRNFKFCSYSLNEKRTIISCFKNVAATGKFNRTEVEQVKKIVGKVTRGNYQRGF